MKIHDFCVEGMRKTCESMDLVIIHISSRAEVLGVLKSPEFCAVCVISCFVPLRMYIVCHYSLHFSLVKHLAAMSQINDISTVVTTSYHTVLDLHGMNQYSSLHFFK